ncbi:hypothetical protein ILUMI_03035, partial [Ignelater luminosus]
EDEGHDESFSSSVHYADFRLCGEAISVLETLKYVREVCFRAIHIIHALRKKIATP